MKKTKAIDLCIPCLVLRDHREREQSNKWEFKPSSYCAGTRDCTLVTGDYTLQGFEKYFTIERKASVNDFVNSIAQKRFKEELIRMSDLPHAFVILEFCMEDLDLWPKSSGKSPYVQSKLPLRQPGAALAAYLQLKLAYPYVDFTFAGSLGKMLASSIFKRIIEAYAKEVVASTT